MTRGQSRFLVVFTLVVIGTPLYLHRDVALGFLSPLIPEHSWLGGALYDDYKTVDRRPKITDFDTTDLRIDPQSLVTPGPAKDGIPALTNPQVTPVADANHVDATARVIGVTIDGESRAYPIRILEYHEVINDQLGDTPIAVTYCPVADSVVVMDRRIDGRVLEFGVSGYLYQSNVVLYDRSDHAMWPQVGLAAASGPLVDRVMNHVTSWQITTFDQWRDEQPQSTVVSFDTGHDRDYTVDPYSMYHGDPMMMFPVSMRDRRLDVWARIIGVKLGDTTRAYGMDMLRASAELAGDPDGIVTDQIDGQTIRLGVEPNTGTVRLIETPQDAKVAHAFWFVWASHHPDTEIYRPQ